MGHGSYGYDGGYGAGGGYNDGGDAATQANSQKAGKKAGKHPVGRRQTGAKALPNAAAVPDEVLVEAPGMEVSEAYSPAQGLPAATQQPPASGVFGVGAGSDQGGFAQRRTKRVLLSPTRAAAAVAVADTSGQQGVPFEDVEIAAVAWTPDIEPASTAAFNASREDALKQAAALLQL